MNTVYLKKLKKSFWLSLVITTVFVTIFSLAYLNLLNKWWFEDDPAMMLHAASVNNPLDIFWNKDVIKGYGAGMAMAPMQIFSYWIDVKMAGFSTVFAYGHNIVCLLLSALMLYVMLFRFTKNSLLSLFGTLSWVLLPSTVVVVHYVSTRHYIEGFIFDLVAIYFAHKVCSEEVEENFSVLCLFSVTLFIAILYKEVHATLLPAFLFLYGVFRKKYRLVFTVVVISFVYALYRIWALGLGLDYAFRFLNLKEYLDFLLALPYAMTANKGGYVIYVGVLYLLSYSAYANKVNIKVVGFFLVLFLVALGTIYPVSEPLSYALDYPGPWYRVVFLVNTIILISGIFILNFTRTKYFQIGVLVLIIPIIMHGTERTRGLWNRMKYASAAEGIFYLRNPEKLLMSQQAATWFIPSVHEMYGVKKKHYIIFQDVYKPGTRDMLTRFPTLWKLHKGTFVQDYSLYMNLLEKLQ